MHTQKHPLQFVEDNHPYFHALASTQSDPMRFNTLAAQIELRIDLIIQYIKKAGKTASEADREFAFALLGKYVELWQLYFLNHPWKPLEGQF